MILEGDAVSKDSFSATLDFLNFTVFCWDGFLICLREFTTGSQGLFLTEVGNPRAQFQPPQSLIIRQSCLFLRKLKRVCYACLIVYIHFTQNIMF